ncbi:MAG: transrane sensor [Gammaproteobacteria bacterium]|jgi:transmembrane sensor|nr:transrane sensor [Gammaproteobacteria bacterium]
MPASDIEAEASEWLIRLERDSSPAQTAAFEEWIAADARNRAVFVRLEKTWRHADVLRKLRPLDGEVDENIIDKFGKPGSIVITPRKKTWLPWLAVAASVLIVAIGAASWMSFTRSGWQVFKTEQGGFQRISLQDGSTAFLNTNSEIHVKLTAARREVVLARGEALFTVAHDTHRPFDVTAADTVVRAVGTAFSVRLRDQQQVDVIVTEGRVAIDPPDDSLNSKLPQQQIALPQLSTLAAGETVSVKARKMNVHKIAAEDMTRKLAWTQGRLWFDRVTLAEAVTEFNRYNRRQLVIDDSAIATLHIGGAFDATDLDSFLAALQSFGIRAVPAEPNAGDPASQIIRLTGPEVKQ